MDSPPSSPIGKIALFYVLGYVTESVSSSTESEPLNGVDSVLNFNGAGRTEVTHDALQIRVSR